MTDIQECAKKYLLLENKKYTYSLENNMQFSINFTDDNFYHLFGLHKLTDVSDVTKFSNEKSKIFKKILNNDDSIVEKISNSKLYYKIENRISFFDFIDELFDLKTCKIIVDFDAALVPETKLKNTVFMLYKRFENGSYFILTIGNRNGFFYPETILYETTNMYISEQELLEILSIDISLKRKQKKDK